MECKNGDNFISYVDFEEHEMQSFSSNRIDSPNENIIKLLPGEVVIAEAQNVLMFSPVGNLKQGTSGILTVTNFKMSFITSNDTEAEDLNHQQNHLYSYTESCLSNINEIYLIVGDKKRKLLPGSAIPSKVKGIFVVCKNFRTWCFSFKFSPLEHGKNLLATLLHHAFPRRHTLLFAYDYKEPYYSSTDKKVKFFRKMIDWQEELIRTTRNVEQIKRSWRLSVANSKFHLSPSLPQYIIVPASITDSQLSKAAAHFQDGRPPIWAWLNNRGAALVKMSELIPTVAERTQENIMLENIRKSHPHKLAMVVIDLNSEINVKAIATGFNKFVSLCSPESRGQFWVQDNNFYSLLENSKWLKFVSYCLQKSVEASEHLDSGISVILQENAGRDICCIISSLVQLLLDPYFRTITGFQSLLQKEWVAGGHPFCDRLGHIVHPNIDKSPVFLLFLDCVWQLCQQFPSRFEFTETYLTSLWDAAHVPIFDTFIFNCERDRVIASMDPNNPIVLRTVWDWREQFSEQDILLFYNPLFDPDSNDSLILKPQCSIVCLELWSQCYFRWIPPLEIRNGGKNHIELFSRLIKNSINQLKLSINGRCNSPNDKKNNSFLVQMNIDSFYPFGNKKTGNTVITPIMNTSMLMNESFLDTQSLLTAPD